MADSKSTGGMDQFRKLLDEQNDWPCPFTFKFVVPRRQLATLERALEGFEIRRRSSRNGNYVSVTLSPIMSSSDEIVDIYDRVSEIPGIVSL